MICTSAEVVDLAQHLPAVLEVTAGIASRQAGGENFEGLFETRGGEQGMSVGAVARGMIAAVGARRHDGGSDAPGGEQGLDLREAAAVGSRPFLSDQALVFFGVMGGRLL